MRVVLSAAVALVVALLCAAAAQPATTFVLKGKGWGHGIGMSQYGAQGFALAGKRFDEILAHYYRGTRLGSRSRTIEVLLAAGRSSLTIGSSATFRAGSKSLSAGTWTVTAPRSGGLRLTKGGTRRSVSSPKRFRPGTAALVLAGRAYRGSIVLRRSGRTVWARNSVGLDGYVRGVVPQEMPTSWHAEALKAQAVAARTYALSAGGHCSWFGTSVMCPDTSDQVYGGKSAEEPSSNAAVTATARRVVLHAGAPAQTFFFSTSGGKTAANSDEWGGTQLPYLVSVGDPFDTLSPHHRWGSTDADDDCPGGGRDCVWTATAMKDRLGSSAPAGLRDMTVTRNGSSRVRTVRATGSGGSETISGGDMRLKLGLRSTWFTIGVLRITGAGTIERGEERTLSLRVRNTAGAKLQRRPAGGAWRDVRSLPAGASSYDARPRVTSDFRISSPSATTKPLRIAVRPSLRFAEEQPAGGLRGLVEPTLAGSVVEVQRRRSDGSWRTVAHGVADADGVWRATFDVRPGRYRASLPSPGAGLLPGRSPAVTVVAP